uniref:Uncharacterized protein n=1 Tax=Oryzias melastigma TaxID=30732 RepID=A0A3B3B4X2_ORYME
TINSQTGLLTFLAWRCAFVWWFLILLLAAQVTGVDRHSGFNLLLGQLHSLIKHLEELLGFVVRR